MFETGSGSNASASALHMRITQCERKLGVLSPAFTTICLSPDHTARDDQQALLDFFRVHYPSNVIPDQVGSYRYGDRIEKDIRLFNLITDKVIQATNRVFEPALAQMLETRGWYDVAAAYRAYCERKMTLSDFKDLVHKAHYDVIHNVV